MTLAAIENNAFIEALPTSSLCADNYKHGSYIRRKAHAIRHRHIELNNDKVFKFISLDIDYDIAEDLCFVWQNNNLPEPTYAVINPSNNHAHLIFRLENYIYFNNDKQVAFYEDVKQMLINIYKADPAFTGQLTKNPLHESWKTIESGIVYTLAELRAYAPKQSTDNVIRFNKFKRRTINNNNADLGHRCKLFENSRIIAYNSVKDFSDQEDFFNYMINVCTDQNPSDLKYSDLLSTAKSISRYTWKHREWFSKGYTRNRVTSIEDLRSRQRAAATTTAGTRQAKTLAIIEQAINSIIKQAVAMPAITKQLIAKLTGKSLSTIKRYATQIDQFIRCAYQVLSPVLTPKKISSPLGSLAQLKAPLCIDPPQSHTSALTSMSFVPTGNIWEPVLCHTPKNREAFSSQADIDPTATPIPTYYVPSSPDLDLSAVKLENISTKEGEGQTPNNPLAEIYALIEQIKNGSTRDNNSS